MPSVENITLNKYVCGIHIMPAGPKIYSIERIMNSQENEKSKSSILDEYAPKNMQHQGRSVSLRHQVEYVRATNIKEI